MHEFNSSVAAAVSAAVWLGSAVAAATWQRRLAFANFSMSPLLNFSFPKRRLFCYAERAQTRVVLLVVPLLT